MELGSQAHHPLKIVVFPSTNWKGGCVGLQAGLGFSIKSKMISLHALWEKPISHHIP
jgi:hypothetical protein